MPSIATWMRQCDEHWFIPIFGGYPHLTVHNARCNPVELALMDALLLTGGGDISAGYLRQPIAQPSLIVDTDLARDEWEFLAVAEMLAAGKPILASSAAMIISHMSARPVPAARQLPWTLATTGL